MKIRKYFVANSSSQSFIIGKYNDDILMEKALTITGNKKEYIDIIKIARVMIHEAKFKHLYSILQYVPNDVKLILFNSCNYETQIVDQGSYAIVLTCNNENQAWLEAIDKLYEKYNWPCRFIEESDDYETIVQEHPCYAGFKEYRFDDLNNPLDAAAYFDLEKFANLVGPAVYMSEHGLVIFAKNKKGTVKRKLVPIDQGKKFFEEDN
jgi:hypothetical protein